jgi:hypothetical protein
MTLRDAANALERLQKNRECFEHDPTNLVTDRKAATVPPAHFAPNTAEAKTRPRTPTTFAFLQHWPCDTKLQVLHHLVHH